MMNILALLQHLSPCLDKTTIRQLSRIVSAMLAMTGRVTMLGISRWTGKGGSYRTVQRFFHTPIPWATLFWLFFRRHLLQTDDIYLFAGDECVVTKAGKQTHGLDRFFSSLFGKPVPSLAFFALSLISVSERRSYPMMIEQVVRSAEEKAQAKAKAEAKKVKRKRKVKGKAGRPKGSKTKDKTKVALTPELMRIEIMVKKLLVHISHALQICYLVMDGKFGNNNSLQMTLQCGLHLISKLRYDSALYFRYDGPYAGSGRPREYGDKVDYDDIPMQYLKAVKIEKEIWTSLYQAEMLHKDFAQALNVVILVKTNLNTGARARVILFSSDLKLTHEQIIDYYSLRFQIEFNFRDAKQHWGLEDFMNVKETAVTNAANLSLFMVNVAHVLLRDYRAENSNVNVLDLKAHFRGRKYVTETLNWLPKKPKPFLMDQIIDKVSRLGRVHNPLPSHFPS
jgi:putative transposase